MSDKNVEGFALSPQQEHLWQVQKTAAVGPYRSWSVYRIGGRLDVAALESAINETVRRHEILRTAFLSFHGLQLPLQVITPPLALPLRRCDSRELALEARTGSFALERGEVLSASLATLSPTEHLLAFSLPGLCADAATLDNLLHEIAEIYHGQTAEGGSEEPLQYVDVAQFFREILGSEEAEAGKEYWRHTVRGSAQALLPLEERQPKEDEFAPSVVEQPLGAEVFRHAETIGNQLKVGVGVFFLHCWQILLCRVTGLPGLTVATVADGRGHEGLQEALGLFARHLPVPAEAAEDIPFSQSIQRARSSVLAAQRWQETFSWPLVKGSREEESAPGYWPFCFELRKAPASFTKDGLSFSPLTTEALWDRFKLKLVLLRQRDDGLMARFEYDEGCLSSRQVERLAAAFEELLQACLERPDTRVSELPIVGRDEWRHLVVACNDTRVEHPQGERLHDPFETQAERTPDAVAMVFGAQQMTYRELDRRANQLAHRLHALGVGPESMVAIHLERSLAMVESILAVLKAGSAYLPLDPDYPRERLAYILEDAGASVLLTEGGRTFGLPATAAGVTILDVEHGTGPEGIESPPRVEGTDASLAYVIYTSGSTGRPKGVMVSHRAIVNRLRWMQREFPLTPADRVLQKTPYGFDASIWELFSPLWAGVQLVLAEPGAHRDSARMVELIVTQGVTRLQLVPSLLRVFLDEPRLAECRSLEHLFCGGEALLGEWRERVFERLGCRLTNLYGPTEAAIDASFHSCRQGTGEGIEPIGRPLDNVQIYLLGPEMKCVATGMAGHLHIGGAGLARGYHGRPDLTAQRFLPDFLSGVPGGRLYATGDLARQREDGTIEYLGRIDHQVKIHGVRIELGEIEAVLSGHPGVQEAVVVAQTGETGALRLAAYAVPLRPQSLERLETLTLPNGLEVAYLNRNETQTIYREIFEDMTYLRHGIELPDGACVFDVGANIGLFTLFVHQSCRNPRVFAFEPIPPTFARLRRNVELYGLDVELSDCGVGSNSGNATFTFYRSWSGMSGMHADRAEDEAMTRALLNNQDRELGENADQLLEGRFETELFSCRLTTLSEEISRHGIDHIDLLKVDVEKSELAVLAGIAESDWGKIRQIVLEAHNRNGELAALTGLLHDHGFELLVEQDAWLAGTGLYNVYAVHRAAGGLKPKRNLARPQRLEPVAARPPSSGDLRDYLRARLPEPTVPAHIVILDALPRMANGKVDRKNLPAPEQPGARESYVAPRTREEKLLAEIWAQLLRLPRVGVNDNFFELGGDSILSVQIAARARQAGLHFTVRQIFEHQTVAALARHATAADRAGLFRPGQEPVSGEVPFTPIQRSFFGQAFADPHHFNQALLLESREPLAPAALDRATAALVEHHDALRLRFDVQPAGPGDRRSNWRQENAPAEPATPFHQIDLAGLPASRRDEAFERAAAAVQAGFDLAAGPLTRLCLFHLGGGQPERLLWITHHLVVDGVSWRVLLEDLEEAYGQAARGERIALPPKTTSFQEWARRLAGHAGSEALARELEGWCETVRASAPRLPVDFPEAVSLVRDQSAVSFELGADETADLLQTLPSVYHSRIDEALLSALARALARWTGSPRLWVDLEGHGREPLFDDLDVSRTVGWFTTVYPVVLEAGDAGPGDALVSAKERLRAVPGRGIGYGLLRHLREAGEGGDGEAVRLLQAAPPAEVSFNYLGQVDATSEALSLFRVSSAAIGSARSPRAHRPYLLDINGIVAGGRLRITLTYGSRTHRRETMERLAADYAGALRELIRHARASQEVFTPSDFPRAGLDVRSFHRLATLLHDPAEPIESVAGGLGLTLKNVADIYPLTPLQNGVLFHSLMEPASGVYVGQATCTLPADLDPRLFRQAWERLAERHGVLRTAFLWDGLDEPRQVVRRNVPLPWQDLDWRGLPADEQQRRFDELCYSERYEPLPLSTAPLMRFSLVRLDRELGFIWTWHHLLVDGWSCPLLLQELRAIYAALQEGREPELPPARPFGDYIVWLQKQDPARMEPFWRGELAGFTAPNSFGIAPRAGTAGASRYAEHGIQVSREVTTGLRALAARHRWTLQTVTLGAWALLVSRYSREKDVVFGNVISGRPADLPGVETMVGLFINTLPVRVRIDGAELLAPWLQRLLERQLARQEFEHTPLALIQRWSDVPAGTPLFETLYAFENYPRAEDGGPNSLRIGNLRIVERTNYPVTLALAAADRIALQLRYDRSYIDEAAAARLLNHLATLLTAMAGGQERRVGELDLLTTAELRQVLGEWNDTRVAGLAEGCLHHAVARQAARMPFAVAVELGDERWTYRRLVGSARLLARHLRELGVGPDVIVGLCADRSPAMVVGMLAILEAGGAWLPLDPAYPQERLAFMLDDSGARVLLLQEHLRERLAAADGLNTVPLDARWDSDEEIELLGVEVTPDHLAYVIYTSGSTGRPKGVMVPHRGICNRLGWAQQLYRLDERDAVLQKASFGFDFSVWECFAPLWAGGRLVLAEPGRQGDVPYLVRVLREHRVTFVHFVPSMLAAFLAEEGVETCDSLRQVFSGGEALTPELRDRALALLPAAFDNEYGPTETSVDSTQWACKPGQDPHRVPIGRPIFNTQAYVVDPELRPVPVGVAGELLVGGAGVTRGYLRRSELTAERFIPDPFGGISGAMGTRLYRTGDLVCWLPDGAIDFLGRIDHQVKLRGLRIELGEVEAVLSSCPGVQNAAVVLREDLAGGRGLVAFVVAEEGAGAATAALRDFARGKLPDYMVPDHFVFLERLPLTSSGKVDRKALSNQGSFQATAPEGGSPQPRTPFEEILGGIFAKVLRVEDVGAEDDFFELGGHSLLAMQIMSRVRGTFGVELPLRTLFEAPTTASLAAVLEAELVRERVHEPPLLPVLRTRDLPLSFAQERLWFLDQLEPGSSRYNVPVALRMTGALDRGALEGALSEIARRHETLRTTFAVLDGRPIQVIHPAAPWHLPLVDLGGLPESRRERETRRLARQEVDRPFDLEHGPLRRACLIRLRNEEHAALLTLHHVVSDEWSTQVLVREFRLLYTAFLEGSASPLPELPIQYVDFAVWQRGWLQGDVLEEQLSYWRRQLGGDLATLELPVDHPRPPVQTRRRAWRAFSLLESTSASLKALGRREEATLFMTLLAAFQALVHRYTGQRDINLGTPIAGRQHHKLEDLIGFFANMLVVRANLAGDIDFRQALVRTRETALEAYTHQDLPFERLVDELKVARDPGRTPLFQVVFTLQNAGREELRLPGLELEMLETEAGTALFDLTLSMTQASSRLFGRFVFNADLLDPLTVDRMAGHFRSLLEGIVAEPEQRISDLPLLAEEETHQILREWNPALLGTPGAGGVHELFEAQVERTPDAVAAVFAGRWLSYRELNGRANQLARRLRRLGVGPEVRVGICMERSLEVVVGLLGVLKAGGAYLPLDPTYPRERLEFMIEDGRAAVLIAQPHLLDLLPEHQLPVVRLEPGWEEISSQSRENPRHEVGGENLAYVMYTSGSTGRPKGVCVPHRALQWFVSTLDYVAPGPGDRLAQGSTHTFDAATFELFGALVNGARLVGIPKEVMISPRDLAARLEEEGVSVLYLTAALFMQTVREVPAAFRLLRRLLVGGEVVDTA
ncbi:MAG TPA: amino acid adenylation domain-containing protein, partial [Thermoanaerobaculia bacterium]|nr:amino acid adenylation domain-containing protein [Thermoanaerobaculia bacterium]